MFHKGLNQKLIIKAAEDLMEECGEDIFSMRLLAERLGVKTASLYAHIDSMERLLTEVGLAALTEQKEVQTAAIEGKSRDEALRALADAYRRFAGLHIEMYRFIMKMPVSTDKTLASAAETVAEPFMTVMNGYNLTDEQKMHLQRALRAVMHGFVSQEENGYFSHYPVSADESYKIAIDMLINGIHGEEAKNGENRER